MNWFSAAWMFDSGVEVMLTPAIPAIRSWKKWPPGSSSAKSIQPSAARSLSLPPTSTLCVIVETSEGSCVKLNFCLNCCFSARTNCCWRAMRW